MTPIASVSERTSSKTKSKASKAPALRENVAGPKSLALFNEEQDYIAPGLQSIALFSKLAMEDGRGATLRDVDGQEYLDFVAGIGVASIGYGHPEYAKALGEQAAKTAVGSFTTKHRVNFVKTLAGVTPKGLTRVQLYSSGAEGVEAALRLAKSRTKKFEVVSFWGGFHGKTGGVLPLLADTFKYGLGPLMPGLYNTPYPDSRRCPLGAAGEHDCGAHCLQFLREKLKRETSNCLSAIIMEPIQGTNGNIVPPKGFVAGVAQIARENGALFISDEMITGFGRTGEWFGCLHEGVTPDIMTVGKGVAGGFPVSGVISTSEIAESKPWANPSGSSSSYGGNPLASAACDVTLQTIIKERLVENSRKVGKALLERFKKMQTSSPIISAVRGRGLMIGVDLVNPRTSAPLESNHCRELFEDCLKRGLITMSYNPTMRVNPPLVITEAEALRGADIFEEALAALKAKRF